MNQTYRVAGIDVHKRMLAVVITDFAHDASPSQRRKFGAFDSDLRALGEWLREQKVQEAVMESTAQYWKPVWRQLEDSVACSWRNRIPTVRRAAVSVTLRMPNGCCGVTWPAN